LGGWLVSQLDLPNVC